jgi:polysaccharide biosynthesis protein PslH
VSGEVLFLAHRMPFPPDRGDKIRSSHILKHLASLGPVHVATFAESETDLAQEPTLAALASSHCLVRRTKPLPLAGAEALLRGLPVSLTAFHSPRIEAYVAKILAERPISAIYVFSGQMGQYLPDDFAGRVVLDFVDVDSAKFEAYADAGNGPRAWIDGREGRLLKVEEERLARRADVCLFVSDEEAELFASRTVASLDIRALRNGIDSESFDPNCVTPEPRMTSLPGPRLIFTGQMDYAPNIAAAERAITRLMPAIRSAIPDASLHIAGRSPPERLQALDGQNGCRVWGEVPDIRTWLAAADLALVPLEIARGVQNKVLEAMAMRLPVVLSPGAATGIGAEDQTHFAIGGSDADLIEQILKLLADPTAAANLGQKARQFVINTLSWTATLAPLGELLSGAGEHRRHAA